MTFCPPCQPAAYCPRAVVRSSREGRHDAGQELLLLHAQRLGLEGDGLLHADEGHELQEVVLDDVACGPDAVVVAGTTADADVLGHRDLDVVDVVGVPDRLEHVVGEPHRQDVLHRLLAEVVVDPEHRVGREHRLEHRVELASGLQVVPERLLDDHAAPRVSLGVGEAVLLELSHDRAEERRGDGEVERHVAGSAAELVELLDRAPQLLERHVVVELARHEAEPLGQLVPHLLAERRPGVLADSVADDLGEVLVGPVAAREADEAEARREQAAVGEVVDRRHDLLAREVARHPEQHEPARPGDPRQPPVLEVAQRVRVVGHWRVLR